MNNDEKAVKSTHSVVVSEEIFQKVTGNLTKMTKL